MKKAGKMNKIDLIDRSSGLEYTKSSIEKFCLSVLNELGIEGWEFSVLFSNDDYIAELNGEFRQKEGPTDVLTFSECDNNDGWAAVNEDSAYYAGDIIISIDSLKRNTEDFDVSGMEELQRLLIHGILHLAGMDHKTNNADEEMLIKQEDILSRFGDQLF